MLNVPFSIVDATVLTQAGYVGEDVESIQAGYCKQGLLMLPKQSAVLFLLMKR